MADIKSGKVKKTPPTNVSADRYNFIGLSETEPDLGVPSTANQVLTSSVQGIRSWVAATALQGTGGSAGTQGTQGIQGLIGNQGTAGFVGSNGSQGIQGTQGLLGFQGVQGRYTLSATAPSSPVVGDAWVDTDDGRTYIYDSTGWFEPYDNLMGLQGTQGLQGLQGGGFNQLQGTQGIQGLQGTQGTFGPATVPLNTQTSSYTLAASDNGKLIAITTGGVTVPVNIFSTGNNIVIYNNSTSNQTITQSTNTTLRLSGTAATGNRTLSQYGIATIICVDATNNANVFTISGAGLS
jgi:hypothetical protein